MPPRPLGTLVLVRPPDVALGIIAHHIHVPQLRCRLRSPTRRSVLAESVFRKGERALRRFPKEVFLQADAVVGTAGDGVEDAFEGGLEAALAEAREGVGCCPEEIRVGVVEGGLGVLLVAAVWEVGGVVFGGEGA